MRKIFSKRFLFMAHSWGGLIAGLGLLLIGLTGSVIVFREEIDTALRPEKRLAPNPEAPRLAPQEFFDRVSAELPDYVVTGWGPNSKPTHATVVALAAKKDGAEEIAYADPATGNVISTPMEISATWINWLVLFHMSFMADHIGLILVAFFALLMIFLAITGVWINRPFWKSFIRLRWRTAGRIFFSDLHKMVGVTNTAFFFLFGVSGLLWNVQHVAQHIAAGEFWDHPPEPAVRHWNKDINLNRLLDTAREKMPGYEVGFYFFGHDKDAPLMMFGHFPDRKWYESEYGSMAVFDPASGELTSAMGIRESGALMRIYDSFRPLHFGSFGGLPVKIIWTLAGLSPGILAVTGFIMWRRRTAPRRKQPAPPAGA